MAETNLRLAVDLEVKQAEKTAKDLQEEVRKIFESRNGEQSAAMTNLELQMKQTYDKAKDVSNQLATIRLRKETLEDFIEINNTIEKTNSEITTMEQIIDRTLSDTNNFPVIYNGVTTSLKDFYKEIELWQARISDSDWVKSHTEAQVEAVKNMISAMQDTYNQQIEKASQLTVEYQGQTVTIAELQKQIEHLNTTIDELNDNSNKLGFSGTLKDAETELQNVTGVVAEYEEKLDLLNDKSKQQIIRHDEMTQREVENYERIGQAADRAAEREELRQQKAEQAQGRRDFTTTRRSLRGLRQAVVGVERLIPGMSSKATSAVFSVTNGVMMLTNVVNEFKVVAVKAIERIGAALLANPLLGPAILAAVATIALIVKEVKKLVGAWNLLKTVAKKAGDVLLSAIKQAPRRILELSRLTLRLGTAVERLVFKVGAKLVKTLSGLKSTIKENLDLMVQWHHGNNDLNKSMSNLTSSLAYLKASLASAFAPILTTIEPLLTSLTDRLAEVTTNVGIFIAQITGQSKFQRAIRYQRDYAKSLADTNEQLASFDKLNIISDGSSDNPEKIGVEFEEVDVEPLNLHIIEELFDKAQVMAKKFTDALNSVPWDTIKQGASDAALGISNFINGFGEFEGLGGSVGTALGEVVNTVRTFFDGLFDNLNFKALGTQIGEFFGNAIDTVKWKEVAKTMWKGVKSALATLRGFLSTNPGTKMGKAFSDFLSSALDRNNIPWKDIKESLNGVVTNIADFLNEVITVENFEKIGTTLGDVMNTIVTATKTFADGVHWEEWGESLGTAINNFFETWDLEFTAETINTWADGLLQGIKAAVDKIKWTEIGDKLVKFLSKIEWKKIGDYAISISKSLRRGLQDVWNQLKTSGAFSDIMKVMKDFFNEYQQWQKMLRQIKWDFIRSWILEAIIESNFFDNLGAELGQKVREGITNWITGGGKVTMNEVLGKTNNDSPIKTYTSSYKKSDTTAQETLTETKETNSTLSDIESLLNERLNPSLKLLNAPLMSNYQIPKLASGTVVPPNTSRFLAMLGDNNRETEVVSPLSTIKQALREAMAEQNVNVTFKVEGDPNGIFKVVQKESTRYNQRTGESAFA